MLDVTLPDGFVKHILGYCDPLSIRAGEKIGFKIGSATPGPAEARVVRLVSGDDRPHGTGLIEAEVPSPINGAFEAIYQPLTTGSYAAFDGMPGVAELHAALYVFPTLLRDEPQTVLNCAGVELCVSNSGFALQAGGASVVLEVPMQARRWHQVSIGAELTVERSPGGVVEDNLVWSVELPEPASADSGIWRLACREPGVAHFNGRIEDVLLRDGTSAVAHWDFCRDINSDRIVDVSGHHRDGVVRQTPTRAVKGVHWDGSSQCWHDKPEHYGAIHFHEDDLTDAAWSDSLVWETPADLASGQYALKLTMGESEDYVPFFVRPSRGPTSDVAYLVSTASYLAYANQRLGFTGGIFKAPKLRHANDAFLYAHEEVGYSLYEHHRDGSGVHFSSRLRPILNMKPRTGTWAFNADTHITAWLDAIGEPFDVLTDEDLHKEGAAALESYRVVITGTHPEYYSTSMLDGLTGWLGAGGRLMYMGGNGFYWRIAHHPSNPAIIEVRRAEDGTRAWEAPHGEYYHQFTGEYGGMWRRLGRPPNQLAGIGFAAQGFDGGTYYRVMPGALDPRVDFIVEGVEGDVWGDFGNQGGGAAGEEIDRWDESLGSPSHAVVLATSEHHKPGMLRVKEEFLMTRPLGEDAKVRADMVFFETPSGGAVFSTGSISYAGSLAHDGYANNIARLTGNVLARFKDPTPFEYPV